MPLVIDWDGIAMNFQFGNCREMLLHYATMEHMSPKQIAKRINVSGPTIAKKMKQLGIKFVQEHKQVVNGRYTCSFCHKDFRGDPRRVCCDKPLCLEKYDRQQRAAAAERRKKTIEKKMNTKNKCQICGKDKGANKFFCPTCHSAVSAGAIE